MPQHTAAARCLLESASLDGCPLGALQVALWDVETQRRLLTLAGHTASVKRTALRDQDGKCAQRTGQGFPCASDCGILGQ